MASSRRPRFAALAASRSLMVIDGSHGFGQRVETTWRFRKKITQSEQSFCVRIIGHAPDGEDVGIVNTPLASAGTTYSVRPGMRGGSVGVRFLDCRHIVSRA